VAANLYNKGVKVKLAAVIGNGMLSVLSSDGSASSVEDLLGKTAMSLVRVQPPTNEPASA
jgi:NitT/TauT family transport system substrate-binding protein